MKHSSHSPAIRDTATDDSHASRSLPPEDSAKQPVEDCTPLNATERRRLEGIAREWYGELGDASARRYWPYAGVDNEALRRAADAGDAEAMFQFGMNMLWKAMRTKGDHWEPEGTRLHETTPARKEADLDSFRLAETYLWNAAIHGKIFAFREMASAHESYPAFLQKILHRDDPQAQQELVDAAIAAMNMLPNYLVAELQGESGRVTLNARTKELAGRFIEGHILNVSLGRAEEALIPPDIDVPNAVLKLSNDHQCRGGT